MELTVYIPTLGRTAWTSITAEEMKKFSKIKPIFVCPPVELATLQNRGYNALACELPGIGPTRQWIIEQCPTRGVVMLDDDLYFSRRIDPYNGGKLEKVTDMDPIFGWISNQLDAGFVHGGVSARQGNQHIKFPWTDCIRVNNAHFVDKEVFLREGVRFDRLPVMEDFHVTLSLLLKGYPNRVLYAYCWSQRGSGFKGGCSIYRTPALQAEAAEALHRAFPDYVRVVEKEGTTGGSVFAGVRKDVQISWLKAWADRQPNEAAPKDVVTQRT